MLSRLRNKPSAQGQKKLISRLFLFVCSFLIASAETATRLYHLLRWDVPVIDGQPSETSGAPPTIVDPELGWRPKEGYRYDGTRRNSDGTKYNARITQDANGFRMFGDLNSGKPRVLVIGDSDTQAIEVSDDNTYYAILKQRLDIEVFAYGARGYGTLQELMILEKYYDVIKPDLVLWQYSIDDPDRQFT
jgi:hypothetical protein